MSEPAAEPPAPFPALAAEDPVAARRARFGRWAKAGKRTGYSLFGVAIVAFGFGAVADFTPAIVAVVVTAMATGSVVLAPSIVVAYGVSAADRDERRRPTGGSRPAGGHAGGHAGHGRA